MSIRPFRDIKRNKTKVINVGPVKIGGNNPISVQSMTNTLTTDVNKTIKQINQISEAGADIVRVSCPDENSTIALKEIKMRPVTETHDYEFKVKNAKKFISKGDKVKFTIRFKGRELQHSSLGNELMDKIKQDMETVGRVELQPKFDGKQMIMVIQPL